MSEAVFELDDYIENGPRFANRKVSTCIKPTEGRVDESAVQPTLEALVPIRESSEFDYGLFEGMITQIIYPMLEKYPELAVLIEHGARVLKSSSDGDELRRHLRAEALYGNKSSGDKPTAWAINIGRCRVIYALASAGKTDASGLENYWINVLAEEIRNNAPTHLYTGPFSRLVRNRDVSAPLIVALRSTGTRVHCLESPDGFLVNNESGAMLWHGLVASAHSEWVSTLTRLQTGVVFHTKQGKWVRGGPLPVIGYKRVTGDFNGPSLIEPDETQRALVRVIIETAASGMSEEEAVTKISEAGGLSRKARGRGIEQPSLGDLRDYKSAVMRVWQHLPTYLSGEYVLQRNNTVPGLVDCIGIPIHRDKQEDHGFFQFRIPFGIPDGGWHDEATIKLAIQRRLENRQKKGGKSSFGDQIRPLTGLGTYIAEGYEYRLTGDGYSYQFRRRIHDSTKSNVFKGFGLYEGEIVGRFTIAGLHQTVASLLRDLVVEVKSDVVCTHIVETEPADLEDLLNRAQEVSDIASRLREFAGSSTDVEEQNAYRKQAYEQLSLAKSLKQQRKELLSNQNQEVAFADTSQILAVAELLDRSGGAESPAFRQALRRVIGNLRIVSAVNEPLAQVSLTAIVRTNLGAITLGPVSRPISNSAGLRPRFLTTQKQGERNVRLAYDILMRDLQASTRALLNIEGTAERMRLLLVLRSLLPNPQAVGALIGCPIPEVRTTVLNQVFTEYGYEPKPLPEDIDPLWAQEIAAIYLQPQWSWNRISWVSGDATWARKFVSWIHRYYGDDSGVDQNFAYEQMGITAHQTYSLIHGRPQRSKNFALSQFAPIEHTTEFKAHLKSNETKRVRLTFCPHCGTREIPHILRIPELQDGYLCSKCRRAPNSTIIYPESYLLPWIGTQLGHKKVRTPEQDRLQQTPGVQQSPFHIPPRHVMK